MNKAAQNATEYLQARSKKTNPQIASEWATGTMHIAELTVDDLRQLIADSDKKDQLQAKVEELLAKLQEHKQLEGVDVEVATRKGWADVIDYVTPMASLF